MLCLTKYVKLNKGQMGHPSSRIMNNADGAPRFLARV